MLLETFYVLILTHALAHGAFLVEVHEWTQNGTNRKEWSNEDFQNSSNVNIVFANDEFEYDYIPDDNGGNYGDLLLSQRQFGDVLIFRETIINEVSGNFQDLQVKGSLRGVRITHLRALNFGRERAYVYRLWYTDSGDVGAVMTIRPNFQVRVFIEIYGIRN